MRASLALGLCLLSVTLCGCIVEVHDTYRPSRPPVGPPPPVAVAVADEGPVETRDFYAALTPYGDWVDVPGYSLCWVPRGMAVGWRPYTRGHWVDSDYGLYWVSDYEWGWACFHYGRWFWNPHFGWCWRPGTVWGPNWCAWRWGSDWCAWAPLPVEAEFSLTAGLSIGSARLDVLVDPAWWICCERGYILAPSIYGYVAPFTRNVTIIHKTKHVTKVVVHNRRAAFVGISRRDLEHAVGHRVQPFRIRDTHSASIAHRDRGGRNGELPVFRPERRGDYGGPGHGRVEPRVMSQDDQRRRSEDYGRSYGRFLEMERRDMDRRHRDEDARPPRTMTRGELDRRHEQERQAFDSHMRRLHEGPPGGRSGGHGPGGGPEGHDRRGGAGGSPGGRGDREGGGGPGRHGGPR